MLPKAPFLPHDLVISRTEDDFEAHFAAPLQSVKCPVTLDADGTVRVDVDPRRSPAPLVGQLTFRPDSLEFGVQRQNAQWFQHERVLPDGTYDFRYSKDGKTIYQAFVGPEGEHRGTIQMETGECIPARVQPLGQHGLTIYPSFNLRETGFQTAWKALNLGVEVGTYRSGNLFPFLSRELQALRAESEPVQRLLEPPRASVEATRERVVLGSSVLRRHDKLSSGSRPD